MALDREADRLAEQAHTDGVALTGPGGLLRGLPRAAALIWTR